MTQTRGPGERRWHYSREGKTAGPVSSADLRTLYDEGHLLDTDYLWSPPMASWQPVGELRNVFLASSAPHPEPLAPPPEPISYLEPPEPWERPPVESELLIYAPFGLRVWAGFIDFLATGVVLFAILLLFNRALPTVPTPAQAALFALSALFPVAVMFWIYFAVAEARVGQTLGMHIAGLSVRDATYRTITLRRATARLAARVALTALFPPGLFFPLFTRRKQALHDILAGCVVLRQQFEFARTRSQALRPRLSRRLIAAALDGTLVFIVLSVGVPILGAFANPLCDRPGQSPAGTWFPILREIATFVCITAYFTATERRSGASPGKTFMALRVVESGYARYSTAHALVRNATKAGLVVAAVACMRLFARSQQYADPLAVQTLSAIAAAVLILALVPLWTRSPRSLPDLLAACKVVRSRA